MTNPTTPIRTRIYVAVGSNDFLIYPVKIMESGNMRTIFVSDDLKTAQDWIKANGYIEAHAPYYSKKVTEAIMSGKAKKVLFPAYSVVVPLTETPAPVEVKPAPEAPTAIVYSDLVRNQPFSHVHYSGMQGWSANAKYCGECGREMTLRGSQERGCCGKCYSVWYAQDAIVRAKPAATTSPALVETGERVIALADVATSEVDSARKRLSEATSAYWNHYRQMETKRGNGRYAKNTVALVRDTESLYNLSKQLGQAATTYAQMVSLTNAGSAE